jgi:hypothetical protein
MRNAGRSTKTRGGVKEGNNSITNMNQHLGGGLKNRERASCRWHRERQCASVWLYLANVKLQPTIGVQDRIDKAAMRGKRASCGVESLGCVRPYLNTDQGGKPVFVLVP